MPVVIGSLASRTRKARTPGLAGFVVALGSVLGCALLSGAAAAAPPNDDCSGAIPVGTGIVTYDSTLATTSLSPPPCSSIAKDIWYAYTAADDGTLVVTNCGLPPAGYDTVIALYVGSDCAGLTQLACNDGGGVCGFNEASASTAVIAGQTYWIRFGSWSTVPGQIGSFSVTFLPPPVNDSCAAAEPLWLDTPVLGSTIGAVNDYQVSGTFAGIGQIAPAGAAGRDVVYTFTAPVEGRYSFRVTSYAAGNPVLYVASACPGGVPPQIVSVLAGANRTGSGTFAAEEVSCLTLLEEQAVYVFVDETSPSGSLFRIEVTACAMELEPNGTPASAAPFAPGMQGSIAPAGDVDFVSLGVLPASSRVFAMIDGVAANSTDFDLRVTTTTDTLEYDDADNDAPFGSLSPNVAGTPTPATPAEVFLRISHFSASIQAEPWRLHAVVQPPLMHASSETEPNDSPALAEFSPGNYFYGTVSSPSDVDHFVFSAVAGQLILLGLDGDPLRNNTPINAGLALLDENGATLVAVNDATAVSSVVSGAGSLVATSPRSPGEALAYRATVSGTYYVRVGASSAGDYLLSIATTPAAMPDYCDAGAASCNERFDEFISGVEIADLVLSSGTESGCFSSFVDDDSAMLQRTVGAGLVATIGNATPETACTAWCDWNQDGQFDDVTERIDLRGSVDKPAIFTGAVVPPASALLGPTRLRLRVWNTLLDAEGLPCGSALVGEVEDYIVVVTPAPAAPPNDLCVNAQVIGNGFFIGTTDGASSDGDASCDSGGPSSRDVWFVYTPATDGLLALNTCGSAIDTVLSVFSACGGSELACSDDCGGSPCGGPASCAAVVVAAGQSVRIRVSDKGGVAGSFTLNASLTLLNDLCDGAILVAVPSATAGTSVGSTLDSGLPDCAPVATSPGNNGGNLGYSSGSVWYRLLGTGGTITVDTLVSSFDTRLHVFSGSCGALTCVTANDDIAPSFKSKVAFQTVRGADYFVLVSGFGTATGTFTFNVVGEDTPGNDHCVNAEPLSITGSISGTTAGATGEAFGPVSNVLATCATNSANPVFDVWYTWTAPCSAPLTISTCGAFDTLLSVHLACPTFVVGNQVAGACNDNGSGGCGPGSQVTFLAESGQTYLIRVASAVGAAAGGDFVLTWALPDADGDGTPDCLDGCPLDPKKVEPGICGCGVSDLDSDGDGVADCNDGCPLDPDKLEPGLCGCGVSDVDSDGDGVPDCSDGCPVDPKKIEPGLCGCGVSDLDSDRDGVPDCNDGCPFDPTKIEPGICGCGVPDTDSDGDGVADCDDDCPRDPGKVAPGVCGCGVPDIDSDGDGVLDCLEECPFDPEKLEPGICGCGVPDDDTDGDGVADCFDLCPDDPDKVVPGVCGCGKPDDDSDGDGIADCIDECPGFDDLLDCNGNGFPDGCDILEGQSADLNANGIPDECECLADLNGDGIVNGGDLGILLGGWGPGSSVADLNFDGVVNGSDLGLLLGSWGVCP